MLIFMIKEYNFTKSILLSYSIMSETRKQKVEEYKQKLRNRPPEYIAELRKRKPEYFNLLKRFGTSLNVKKFGNTTETGRPRHETGNGRGVGSELNYYYQPKNLKLTKPANVAHLLKAKTNKNANAKNCQTKKASPKKNRPNPSVRKIK